MSPFTLKILAVGVAGAVMLSGCDGSQARAQRAFEDYQSAAASGDPIATRDALLRLVAADEDVADYWTELGRVQLQLGAYPQAFNSFSRALELNRSSPDLLRILAQIALHSDRLDLAEDYARQLDLLAPGDEAVLMTRGTVALRQNNAAGALLQTEAILKKDPTDSDARLLQSQALLSQGKLDEAIAVLEKQLTAKPSDVGALRALASFYEAKGNAGRVAELRRKVWSLQPDSPLLGIPAVEASFKAGDAAAGRAGSLRLLGPDASLQTVKAVLEAWEDFWPGSDRIALAETLARRAPAEERVAYAAFLNRVSAPAKAYAIVAPMIQDGAEATNAQAAAVAAVALVSLGRGQDAAKWIDRVLAIDEDNVDAFRARARLELASGRSRDAVNDALKIVTLVPDSPEDRLLLFRAYQSNHSPSDAERTLWQAFHDIPADRHIYAALQQYLAATGDQDSKRRVEREYADQLRDKNLKELI